MVKSNLTKNSSKSFAVLLLSIQGLFYFSLVALSSVQKSKIICLLYIAKCKILHIREAPLDKVRSSKGAGEVVIAILAMLI